MPLMCEQSVPLVDENHGGGLVDQNLRQALSEAVFIHWRCSHWNLQDWISETHYIWGLEISKYSCSVVQYNRYKSFLNLQIGFWKKKSHRNEKEWSLIRYNCQILKHFFSASFYKWHQTIWHNIGCFLPVMELGLWIHF